MRGESPFCGRWLEALSTLGKRTPGWRVAHSRNLPRWKPSAEPRKRRYLRAGGCAARSAGVKRPHPGGRGGHAPPLERVLDPLTLDEALHVLRHGSLATQGVWSAGQGRSFAALEPPKFSWRDDRGGTAPARAAWPATPSPRRWRLASSAEGPARGGRRGARRGRRSRPVGGRMSAGDLLPCWHKQAAALHTPPPGPACPATPAPGSPACAARRPAAPRAGLGGRWRGRVPARACELSPSPVPTACTRRRTTPVHVSRRDAVIPHRAGRLARGGGAGAELAMERHGRHVVSAAWSHRHRAHAAQAGPKPPGRRRRLGHQVRQAVCRVVVHVHAASQRVHGDCREGGELLTSSNVSSNVSLQPCVSFKQPPVDSRREVEQSAAVGDHHRRGGRGLQGADDVGERRVVGVVQLGGQGWRREGGCEDVCSGARAQSKEDAPCWRPSPGCAAGVGTPPPASCARPAAPRPAWLRQDGMGGGVSGRITAAGASMHPYRRRGTHSGCGR